MMGRRHLSAFLYGWGFGAAVIATWADAYSVPFWAFVLVVFTTAYWLDKTAGGSDDD